MAAASAFGVAQPPLAPVAPIRLRRGTSGRVGKPLPARLVLAREKTTNTNETRNSMTFEKLCELKGLHHALLIDSALDMAYGDATRQGAFNTLAFEKEDKKTQEKINDVKKKAKEQLRAKIGVIMESPPDKYDEWQLDRMNELVNQFSKIKIKDKEEPVFTYGNAQKWVNMTMKYLWERGLLKGWSCDQIHNLHIPIDSYILDALCFSSDNLYFPPRSDPDPKKKISSAEITRYVRPSDHIKPWSQWMKEDYTIVRESLNKDQRFDLVWEQYAWLCASRYRSKQDNKNEFTERLKKITDS